MKKLLNLILITIFSLPSCSKKEIPQPIYDYHNIGESWIVNIDDENILSFKFDSTDKEKCAFTIMKVKFVTAKNIILCTKNYGIVGTMLQNETECNVRSCSRSFFSSDLYYELSYFENDCNLIFYFNATPYQANNIAIYYHFSDIDTNRCFQDSDKSTIILDIEFAYINYDY